MDQWPAFLELSALLPGVRLHVLLLSPDVPHAWDGATARFAAPAAPWGSGQEASAAVALIKGDEGAAVVPFTAPMLDTASTHAAATLAAVVSGGHLAVPVVVAQQNMGAELAVPSHPTSQGDSTHDLACDAAPALNSSNAAIEVHTGCTSGATAEDCTEVILSNCGSRATNQRSPCSSDAGSAHAAHDKQVDNAMSGAARQLAPPGHVLTHATCQRHWPEEGTTDVAPKHKGSIELSFRRGSAHELYPGLLRHHGRPHLVLAPNAGARQG